MENPTLNYLNLGAVYTSVGEYDEAREHLDKALAIKKEISDRNGEADCYMRFGTMHLSVDEYGNAREHFEKSLEIRKEIGDRTGEADCYGMLGGVYRSVGEFEKARQLLEKSLSIKKDVGDTDGEAECYGSLAVTYQSVGEHDNAIEHLKKALMIKRKDGDKQGARKCCHSLAISYCCLGRYPKAIEYIKEALIIASETGHRDGKAASLYYCMDVSCTQLVATPLRLKNITGKRLRSVKKLVYEKRKPSVTLFLGHVLFEEGEYCKAEEHFKNSLAISHYIGDISGQFQSLQTLARVRFEEGKNQEATSYLLTAIAKCEKIRGSLRDNDQWKISFIDANMSSYHNLCRLLCETGNPQAALYVL